MAADVGAPRDEPPPPAPLEQQEPAAGLDRLLAGPGGRVALVLGETGSGKSTLVRAFESRHDGRPVAPARIVVGLCDPLAQSRPHGPLADLARQLGGAVSMALTGPAGPSGAFAALLDEFGPAGRVAAVVVEDVHWADPGTLDLLAFLGRRLDQCAALIILTASPELVRPDHPLHTVLAGLPSERVTRLRIPPLSVAAVAELAARSGLADPEPAAVELHRRTGGNPLLVRELLAAHRPATVPAFDDPPAEAVPPRIAALTRSRLAALGEPARATVRLVATDPDGLEPALLARAGLADPALVGAGLAAGLLVETGGRVRVRHDVVRQAVAGDCAPFEWRAAHRRVLDCLLELSAAPGPNSARLVRHALGCGDGGVVARQAPAAARLAAVAGEHRTAVGYYEAALDHAAGLSVEERAALWDGLAGQAYLAGDAERAIAARRAALELWTAADRPVRIGEDLRRLSQLYWWTGQRAAAEAAAEQAVRILEPGGPSRLLALAYADRCRLDVLVPRPEPALAWGLKAIRAARLVDEPRVSLSCLVDLATARLGTDPVLGRHELEQCWELARDHRFADEAVRALAALAGHDLAYRDLRAARVALDRAFAMVEAGGVADADRARLLGLRAMLRLEGGDWAGADADARAALDADARRLPRSLVARCVAERLRVRRGSDQPSSIDGDLAAAVWAAGELRDIVLLVGTRAEAALSGCFPGFPLDDLRTAFDLARAAAHPWYAGELAWWLRRADAAPPVADWYAEPYRALLSGDWQTAARCWHRSGHLFEHAEALSVSGTPSALHQALTSLDALDARATARALRRRLRSCSSDPVPRGPRPATAANPAGLTPRQWEVMTLLSADLTNADIAARLNLSIRTAEHHVAAVLAKLAVASRRQVAEAARRLGIAMA